MSFSDDEVTPVQRPISIPPRRRERRPSSVQVCSRETEGAIKELRRAGMPDFIVARTTSWLGRLFDAGVDYLWPQKLEAERRVELLEIELASARKTNEDLHAELVSVRSKRDREMASTLPPPARTNE